MHRLASWKVLLQVAGFVALAGFPGPATAQERRCNELGANCQCSETFDTNSWTLENNGQAANPADTNTKQCRSDAYYTAKYLVAIPETGMPAGNSVNWVWRNNSTDATHFQTLGTGALQPNTKRVCIRNYFRLASNYMPSGCEAAGKVLEITHVNSDTSRIVQFQAHTTNSNFNMWSNWKAVDGGVSPYSRNHTANHTGNLTVGDCLGEWCMAEYCESGDFTGSGGSIYGEGYIRRVRDGKRTDWARDYLARPSSDIRGISAIRLMNGYRGPEYCTGISLSAFNTWRDTSYTMQAEWTTESPGTFIGPAYEIEGGTAQGNTTPPPTDLGQPGTPSYVPQ